MYRCVAITADVLVHKDLHSSLDGEDFVDKRPKTPVYSFLNIVQHPQLRFCARSRLPLPLVADVGVQRRRRPGPGSHLLSSSRHLRSSINPGGRLVLVTSIGCHFIVINYLNFASPINFPFVEAGTGYKTDEIKTIRQEILIIFYPAGCFLSTTCTRRVNKYRFRATAIHLYRSI